MGVLPSTWYTKTLRTVLHVLIAILLTNDLKSASKNKVKSQTISYFAILTCDLYIDGFAATVVDQKL